MPHSLQPFLAIHIVTSSQEIPQIVPPGWKSLGCTIRNALDRCDAVGNITLDIRDGVLYISEYITADNAIIDLVVQATKQKSARMCMMCGEFGVRRKEQEGKPSLCAPHYIEYINAIED